MKTKKKRKKQQLKSIKPLKWGWGGDFRFLSEFKPIKKNIIDFYLQQMQHLRTILLVINADFVTLNGDKKKQKCVRTILFLIVNISNARYFFTEPNNCLH